MALAKMQLRKGGNMKVVKVGTMPDGTKVQIEDWSLVYSSFTPKSTLAAYPISKVNIIGVGAPKIGETFRASFSFTDGNQAEAAFERLTSGAAELKDYERYLKNQRHAICL